MKRLAFILPAVTAVIVGGYVWVSAGRFSLAAFWLVGGAAALGWALWLLVRSAQVLVTAGEDEVRDVVVGGRRRRELEREKYLLLKALKELEFDHEMGKVSQEDFREIGGQYRARAMRVLRQLDDASGDYAGLIARELKARKSAAATTKGSPKADVDDDAKSPQAESAAPAENMCPQCTVANDHDAIFCKKCGFRFGSAA